MNEQEEFEFRLRLEREQETQQPKSKGNAFVQLNKNIGGGLLRGAGSIGATLLAPKDMISDALDGKGLSIESNRQRRKDMDAALSTMGAETDSLTFQGAKLGGEIAGTAGTGGVLAGLLSKIPGLAAKAPALIAATQSGGMSAGGLTGAAGVATRAVGGIGTGGTAAALVNPEDAAMGAVIGGAAGPVVQGAVKLGRGAANVMRGTPKDVMLAKRIADTVGMPKDQLMSLLQKQGPQLIDGYQATVPQLVQNPAVSQLQRTLKTAGNDALGGAERLQQEQFMQTLNRVAPVDLTVQDAAARAGGAIEGFALPAREQASKNVRAAFDAIDPFGESALAVPLKSMESAVNKFLGAGTFGTGSKANQAIATAKEVGTEFVPGIKPLPASANKKAQNLEQAVRAAGGIKIGNSGLAGEVRAIGNKQSGTSGLMNNKSGQSADLLAQDMYERGFIADNDPATLLQALRNGGGRGVYASDATDDGFRFAIERSMGDAPVDQIMPKNVPYQVIQNLRSSIGEAAESASMKGANKEAAALRTMISEIDSNINRAATGNANAGEFFPQDMADQYRKALAMHADKMARFETGPQVGIFRQGGDGQASMRGAEIPGKFYSGRRSQVDDMQAFKNLIGADPQAEMLRNELQRYATTEAAGTATQAGNLSSKYGKWLASRSGANRELFDGSQNASLKAIDDAITSAANAENLGRVAGSDTAQKLQSLQSIGLLDSKVANIVANRIPIIGNFTGPMLDRLRETASQKQSDILANLLANPQSLANAINKADAPVALKGALAQALLQSSGRALPAIYAD